MNKTNTNKILKAKLGQFVQLSKKNNTSYQYEVTFEKFSEDGTYHWTARIIGDWHNIYPMRTVNEIKSWKTLDGAKKNFINTYANRVR